MTLPIHLEYLNVAQNGLVFTSPSVTGILQDGDGHGSAVNQAVGYNSFFYNIASLSTWQEYTPIVNFITGQGSLLGTVTLVGQRSATITGTANVFATPNNPSAFITGQGSLSAFAGTISGISSIISGQGSLRQTTTIPFVQKYGCILQVEKYATTNYGTSMTVPASINSSYTTNINVTEDYLLPTSSITASGNIFQPTIIVNGAYVAQNAATDPGGDISATSLYINIQNAGLTNISACDLEGYSFTLDYNGGSFNIISSKTMGNLGDVIDLYGFKGTITTTGQTISNSQAGFVHRGIFGQPKLNRFFEYISNSITTLTPLTTNPAFFNTLVQNWQSASSIARAIAGIAGINFQWLIFDVPVSDFRIEATMSALDALSSMAQRAGGQLRWNGDNSYIVCYPDYFFGYWNPPSCTLVNSDGLSNENYLDMTTGLYGTNPGVLVSYTPKFNAGIKTLPVPTNPSNPQVQQVAKIKTNMTTDDPPLIYDLPFDYDQVFIQILVSPTGDTGGTNSVSINNFVTTDPGQWFEYSFASLASDFVFVSNVGGAYIPQVKVDSRVFPSPNSSVENGNFVMTIACTRKNLPSSPASVAQQAAAAGLSQDHYRFIKTYSGTFSTVFFGSIPVPGMWASATVPNVRLSIPNNSGGYDIKTIGDVTVQGIIESVNFSFPGFITVTVAQYKRLYYSEVPYINYGNQL